MKHGWWMILLVFAFSSCEEEYQTELAFDAGDFIVVEGMLTTERKRHVVHLTKPFSTQNDEPEPISGAVVAMFDQDEVIHPLLEVPRGSGRYVSTMFRANFGKFYGLYIQYEGKEYVGFDTPPPGEFLEPLVLDTMLINGTPMYAIANTFLGDNPSYVEYDIDWSDTDFCTVATCEGKQITYDLKNIDVQETFAPDKEPLLFPAGSRIVRRRHAVSDRYKEYLRGVLSETEWRGGFFDVERENATGNMSEGALGFFAVTSVTIDTIYVQ